MPHEVPLTRGCSKPSSSRVFTADSTTSALIFDKRSVSQVVVSSNSNRHMTGIPIITFRFCRAKRRNLHCALLRWPYAVPCEKSSILQDTFAHTSAQRSSSPLGLPLRTRPEICGFLYPIPSSDVPVCSLPMKTYLDFSLIRVWWKRSAWSHVASRSLSTCNVLVITTYRRGCSEFLIHTHCKKSDLGSSLSASECEKSDPGSSLVPVVDPTTFTPSPKGQKITSQPLFGGGRLRNPCIEVYSGLPAV